MNIKEEAYSKMKSWFRLANVWRVIDYTLPTASFISSMIVVFSGVVYSNRILILLFSVIAAVLTMMSFAIEPRKHMRNYRIAFSRIYSAIIQYEETNGKNRAILENALLQAESMINSSYDSDLQDWKKGSEVTNGK